MPGPKILVIPGSTRVGSHNVKLAALAVKELTLNDIEVTRISLADYELPLYEDGIEIKGGPPANARQAQADDHGAPGRVHRQPGILSLGHTYAQKRHRLGLARARARRSDLCRVQGPRLRDRRGLARRCRWRCARSSRCGKSSSLVAARWSSPSRLPSPTPTTAFDAMDNLTDTGTANLLRAQLARLVEVSRLMM